MTKAAQYIAQAQAALTAGFRNEASRKAEGLEVVARAYRETREAIVDATIAALRAKDLPLFSDMDMPFDLHNFRQKHADYALQHAPQVAELLEQVKAEFALRNEIKAANLLPKKTPKRDQPIQEGDKTQVRGNCQICGRDHAVVGGFMSKHGYTVERDGMYGYFSGVCAGHNYQPMQVNRTQTDAVADDLRNKAIAADIKANAIESGAEVPAMVTVGHGRNKREIPFAEASKVEQRQEIQSRLWNQRNMARAFRNHADQIQALATKLHGQPLKTVKV